MSSDRPALPGRPAERPAVALPGRPSERPVTVLRSPMGLSYAAVALLSVVIIADLFSIFASLTMGALMAEVADGSAGIGAAQDAERADGMMMASGVAQLVALLATAVVFIQWFRQVRANADVFAQDLQRRSKGWAIAGWLVPFANLYIPRGMAADIWEASRQDPYGPKGRERHTLINFWWIFWLLSLVVDRVAVSQYEQADTADAVRAAANALVVNGLIDITAAVLAILVVRRITVMQRDKALRPAQESGSESAETAESGESGEKSAV